MFVFHMAHVNVHQRSSGKEMVGFGRNHSDFMVAEFTDMPSRSNARNAVSYNYNVMHSWMIIPKLRFLVARTCRFYDGNTTSCHLGFSLLLNLRN